MVLADYRMALAGPQSSLDWAVPVGRTDSQVGLQVDLGKVVPASSEPGCTVNLEHKDRPQEQGDAKCPHARQADPENHTRGCRLVHNAKRKTDKDLGGVVQLRRSAAAKTTDTPPERYSLV